MNKGDNVISPSMDGEELNVVKKAISIIKTRDIYCGGPTAGYQVVRAGLDITFPPDLDKVHTLIDEYYDEQKPESRKEGED